MSDVLTIFLYVVAAILIVVCFRMLAENLGIYSGKENDKPKDLDLKDQ